MEIIPRLLKRAFTIRFTSMIDHILRDIKEDVTMPQL